MRETTGRLTLSLVAAAVVLVALLVAFGFARVGRAERRFSWQPAAVVAVMPLVVLGVVVVRGARDEAAERRTRAEVRAEIPRGADVERWGIS